MTIAKNTCYLMLGHVIRLLNRAVMLQWPENTAVTQ